MKLERIASSDHGVVTRAEALIAGCTPDELRHRLGTGALLATGYRGVYRLGHRAPSVEADYMAAVKACARRDRAEAELSGFAAAYLLGLEKGKPPPPEVSCRRNKRIPGLRTRWIRRGPPPGRTTWRGIPVTTPAQTIVDLAGRTSDDELAAICHEAGVKHGTTPRDVARILEGRPPVPGAARLRRILTGETRVTLSYLERRFLALLRRYGLPLPETNRATNGRRLDCRWPGHRLTVELDSYRFHSSRHAWERDRRREREAFARGDEFRRYTYEDVTGDPRAMLAELAALLSRPVSPRGRRGPKG